VTRFTLSVAHGSPGHRDTGSPGAVPRAPRVATITFDDGGMNLLSSAALVELGDVVGSLTRRHQVTASPGHQADGGHGVTGSRGHEAGLASQQFTEASGHQAAARAASPGAPVTPHGDPVTPGDPATQRLSDPTTLIFRSGRARLFAAGADMAEMRAFNGWDAYEFARLGQELFATIERLPFATICFIDGDCFGGALDLALAFDLRIATPRSRFSHPGAKIGIVTGFGGTSRWRNVIDAAAARRLFLSNETFDAKAAASIGLVDEVAESPDSAIARIADMDPRATQFVKELSCLSRSLDRGQLLLLARRLANIYFPPQRGS
jgi:enoyl-CoA hydratase